MFSIEKLRQEAKFVDVTTWSDEIEYALFRFPNDEIGHARAVEYRNAYNASLKTAMGITDDDLELQSPDWNQRPEEYDQAMHAELYRLRTAGLSYYVGPQVIGNDDPMPTDYPHDH
jgi:hypothetical protein